MSKNNKDKKDKQSTEITKYISSIDEKIKEVEDYVNNADLNTEEISIASIIRRSLLQNKSQDDTSPFSDIPIQVYDVIESVIKHHTEDLFENIEDLNAKEEDISASLSIKITESLIGKIRSKLDGKKIGEYKFNVKTQKKQKQEAYTGADLAGVCTIDQGGKVINKYFLLQAKVGICRDDNSFYAKDKLILKQAINMLKITPSSFFIIYTNKGFRVVSAMNVLSIGKNKLDTRIIQSKPYEEFNNLLLDCFVGDNRFEKKEWRDYIEDPKNNPVPFEEALLHLFVKKESKENN